MGARIEGGRARGFSLVELLVATMLGLLIVSGVITAFAANKRSSDLNTAMTDLQESARFALNMIARNVRMSGHQGCLDINSGAITIRANSAPSDDLRASSTSGSVVVSADRWEPRPEGFVEPTTNPAVAGTHTLQLQYGEARRGALATQMQSDGSVSPSGPLVLAEDIGLAVGDLAIVANCNVGDLFAVTGVSADGLSIEHGAGANTSDSLTLAYGAAETIDQTYVTSFVSNSYYVGETGRANSAGEAVRALYQQSLPYAAANPPTELVEGVEDMRVAFGIRLGDGSLRYVHAGDAAYDPSRVETVKVGLLMSSWEEFAGVEDTRTYVLAGQPVAASDDTSLSDGHPKDRRLRIAFNTTIKVRNRRRDS